MHESTGDFRYSDSRRKTIGLDLATGNRLKKGQFLFNQGDEGDKVFLIQTGKVMLQKFTEDGVKIVIDILKPGDLIAESVIFEKISYPFSCIAFEIVSFAPAQKMKWLN